MVSRFRNRLLSGEREFFPWVHARISRRQPIAGAGRKRATRRRTGASRRHDSARLGAVLASQMRNPAGFWRFAQFASGTAKASRGGLRTARAQKIIKLAILHAIGISEDSAESTNSITQERSGSCCLLPTLR